MQILITSKLVDHKLKSTIAPLVANKRVQWIYLVRRMPLQCQKVINYCPPVWLRWNSITSELYRIVMVFYLTFVKKVDLLIGIYFNFHGVYAGVAAILAKKPFILLIVENIDLYKNNWLFAWLAQEAKAIGVRGTGAKKYLMEEIGLDSKRIFIPPDILPWEKCIDENVAKAYHLMYVGYLRPEKRVDIFIQTVAQLKQDGIVVQAAIVGDGPLEKKLKQQAVFLGVADQIAFLGNQDNVFPYLAQTMLLMITSETEGLPVVCMEAMLLGVPCIVPDVGDTTDYAKDGYNARVVEPLNVDQFVQAAAEVLKDPVIYKGLRRNTLAEREARREQYTLPFVQALWDEKL